MSDCTWKVVMLDDGREWATNARTGFDPDVVPEMLDVLRRIRNDCDQILAGDDMSGMSDADLFGAIRAAIQPVLEKATA